MRLASWRLISFKSLTIIFFIWNRITTSFLNFFLDEMPSCQILAICPPTKRKYSKLSLLDSGFWILKYLAKREARCWKTLSSVREPRWWFALRGLHWFVIWSGFVLLRFNSITMLQFWTFCGLPPIWFEISFDFSRIWFFYLSCFSAIYIGLPIYDTTSYVILLLFFL